MSRILIVSVATLIAACSGGGAQILQCTGTCSCDNATRTCTCSGGSTCAVQSAPDITLQCQGNAACDLTCAERCNVQCGGTSGCTAHMGAAGMGSCFGTGTCDFHCQGSCTVTCTGSSSCVVRCPPLSSCMLQGCTPTDCGGGVQACRTACPPPMSDGGP